MGLPPAGDVWGRPARTHGVLQSQLTEAARRKRSGTSTKTTSDRCLGRCNHQNHTSDRPSVPLSRCKLAHCGCAGRVAEKSKIRPHRGCPNTGATLWVTTVPTSHRRQSRAPYRCPGRCIRWLTLRRTRRDPHGGKPDWVSGGQCFRIIHQTM